MKQAAKRNLLLTIESDNLDSVVVSGAIGRRHMFGQVSGKLGELGSTLGRRW